MCEPCHARILEVGLAIPGVRCLAQENHCAMPKKNRNKKQSPGQVVSGVTFSGCARDYAAALADPRAADPCCMPLDPFPVDSLKTKAFCRGTMSTGGTGLGIIAINVGALSCPPGSTGTGSGVIASNSGYTSAVVINSGTTVQQLDTNSPFTQSTLGTNTHGVQFRTVAAGLYVRSTTAPLYAQGRVSCAVEVQHESLQGIAVPGGLLSYDNTCSESVTEPGKEWVIRAGSPMQMAEMNYQSATVSGGGWADLTATQIVFAVDGANTSQSATFEFEAWAITEWTGPPARGKSRSYMDPIGAPAVVTAVQESVNAPQYVQTKATAGWSLASILARAAQVVKSTVTFISNMPGPRAARAGVRLLMPSAEKLAGEIASTAMTELDKAARAKARTIFPQPQAQKRVLMRK